MKVDYYQLLEVPQNADDKTVKDAYLRLATKWHPENNPDTKVEAERYFFRISEAYQILSCPSRRKRYQQCLSTQEVERSEVRDYSKRDSGVIIDGKLEDECETALRKNFLSEKGAAGEVLSFPSNLISLRDPYKVHMEAVCNTPVDLSDRAFCEQLVQRHIAKGSKHTKNVDPFGNKTEIATVQTAGGEMTLNVTRNGKPVDIRYKTHATSRATSRVRSASAGIGSFRETHRSKSEATHSEKHDQPSPKATSVGPSVRSVAVSTRSGALSTRSGAVSMKSGQPTTVKSDLSGAKSGIPDKKSGVGSMKIDKQKKTE